MLLPELQPAAEIRGSNPVPTAAVNGRVPVHDPEDDGGGAPGNGEGLHVGAGLTHVHGAHQHGEEHLHHISLIEVVSGYKKKD